MILRVFSRGRSLCSCVSSQSSISAAESCDGKLVRHRCLFLRGRLDLHGVGLTLCLALLLFFLSRLICENEPSTWRHVLLLCAYSPRRCDDWRRQEGILRRTGGASVDGVVRLSRSRFVRARQRRDVARGGGWYGRKLKSTAFKTNFVVFRLSLGRSASDQSPRTGHLKRLFPVHTLARFWACRSVISDGGA